MAETDPKTVLDLASAVQTLLQQVQDKFQIMSNQIFGTIDNRSSYIDDLEKTIEDIMTGWVKELEGKNKIAATQELKVATNYHEIWNTIFPRQD